ncbi:MAG: hypothetical protein ABIK28_11010, partial [Planctomycetota bacterium]
SCVGCIGPEKSPFVIFKRTDIASRIKLTMKESQFDPWFQEDFCESLFLFQERVEGFCKKNKFRLRWRKDTRSGRFTGNTCQSARASYGSTSKTSVVIYSPVELSPRIHPAFSMVMKRAGYGIQSTSIRTSRSSGFTGLSESLHRFEAPVRSGH